MNRQGATMKRILLAITLVASSASWAENEYVLKNEKGEVLFSSADYKRSEAKRVLRPDAKIGMDTSDIILKTNWGVPDKKNKTETKHGTSEQWMYENRGYLYFESGKLTAIQTFR